MTSDSSQSGWAVPLSDVLVTDGIVNAVNETLLSGWWSMGPRVEEFEESFAAFTGARHAISVANGTAALHLALLATGCGPGDEVVLPSLNFVAAANVISHTGARPVFCDILSAKDLNMDPADVERAIGPATKALLLLHYGGFACDIDALVEIARRHDLVVVEDAAHAVGSTVEGKGCGTFGNAGCFSFFSNKNLPIGEGGMIVTDDDDLAARLRLLRSHGMTTLTWARHRGHAHSYDVVARGFNYRLDELRAAVGLVQLRGLPDANRERARIASRYRRELESENGIVVPFAGDSPDTVSAHHLSVIVLPEGASRSSVRTFLAERRIQTSVHYPPIHLFTEYARDGQGSLPVTEEISTRILTLPLFPHMRDEQVGLVIESVLEAIDADERASV